jgi:nucleoside-diphosphate-sugar epimerase
MKIFVAGGTGAIGRPLIAELLAKGHALVALIHFLASEGLSRKSYHESYFVPHHRRGAV